MTDKPESWPVEIEAAIPAYLGRQRWFGEEGEPETDSVGVSRASILWESPDGGHRLWQVLVASGADHYQLVLGQRPAGEPAEFLNGHEDAVLGSIGASYLYDATLDAELARELLLVASQGSQTASRARPLSVEQSNTSVVYDDRLILKIFRRLRPGQNPDVEVTTALAEVGFSHLAQPLIRWRDQEYDFGFGQQFLAGGAEGWALALTSLRDLYSSEESGPSDAGGDFAAEGRRLGQVTSEMHLALSTVFPPIPGEAAVSGWRALVEGLETRLAEAGAYSGSDLMAKATTLIADLRSIENPGPAMRVHGDFHLGQVMRTDAGWCVLDFEGEPAKPVEERIAPASVLKDVTSMLRSFHYASRHAILERALPDWDHLDPLARSWESHNRTAFVEGYLSNGEISRLLPDPQVMGLVMSGYELDKALYELDYERAHRPEWVPIPMDALERLLSGSNETGTGSL